MDTLVFGGCIVGAAKAEEFQRRMQNAAFFYLGSLLFRMILGRFLRSWRHCVGGLLQQAAHLSGGARALDLNETGGSGHDEFRFEILLFQVGTGFWEREQGAVGGGPANCGRIAARDSFNLVVFRCAYGTSQTAAHTVRVARTDLRGLIPNRNPLPG